MCTFLKGDYERYKVKKDKQLADGGHMEELSVLILERQTVRRQCGKMERVI